MALAVGMAAMALVNVVLFIALPEYPLGGEGVKVLSWETLRHNDAYYQERFDAICEHFPAESTAILAANWRHVQWYLPDYVLIPVNVISKWERGAGQIHNPQGKTKQVYAQDLGLIPADANNGFQIIIFDNSLEILNETPQLTHVIKLDSDGYIGVLTLSGDQVLYYGGTFGIREP